MNPPTRGSTPSLSDPRALAAILEHIEVEVAEDLVRAAPPDLARAIGLGFERIGGAAVTIASSIDVLMYNRAMALGVEEPATENALDASIACLKGSGVPRFFVSQCPHAQPPDLAQWLGERGLERYNQWAKLWRDVSPPRPVTTQLQVERIDKYQAESFGRLAAEGFQMPDLVARWVTACVGRPGWSHYIAFDRATPVATAVLFVSGDVGYFGMATTKESHRRQGAQHALIARRIRDAAAQGCRMIVVETAEDTPEKPAPSFRNLKRCGFQVAYMRPNWIWKR
jgi:GNAT superfamily N-acetyltransferase